MSSLISLLIFSSFLVLSLTLVMMGSSFVFRSMAVFTGFCLLKLLIISFAIYFIKDNGPCQLGRSPCSSHRRCCYGIFLPWHECLQPVQLFHMSQGFPVGSQIPLFNTPLNTREAFIYNLLIISIRYASNATLLFTFRERFIIRLGLSPNDTNDVRGFSRNQVL